MASNRKNDDDIRVRVPADAKRRLRIAAGIESLRRKRPVKPATLAREILERGLAEYEAEAAKLTELVAS